MNTKYLTRRAGNGSPQANTGACCWSTATPSWWPAMQVLSYAWDHGVLSHVNPLAAALGLAPGMTLRDALR
ncbi:MAG: hypothetical protein ABI564_03545 [Ideonella sp.]